MTATGPIRLSMPDVAHIYKIPSGTLRRWVHEDKLHLDSQRRINLDELDEILDHYRPRPPGHVAI